MQQDQVLQPPVERHALFLDNQASSVSHLLSSGPRSTSTSRQGEESHDIISQEFRIFLQGKCLDHSSVILFYRQNFFDYKQSVA